MYDNSISLWRPGYMEITDSFIYILVGSCHKIRFLLQPLRRVMIQQISK